MTTAFFLIAAMSFGFLQFHTSAVDCSVSTAPCGSYCASSAVNSSECAGGSYSAAGAAVCTPCQAGNYCPPASCSPTTCPIGYYCPSGGAASPMSCGQCGYCSSTGMTSQSSCPAGSYVSSGGSSPNDCRPCLAGRYCNGGCPVPCGCQNYCGSGSSSPSSCGSGTYSLSTTTLSTDCRDCQPGQYCSTGACSPTACPVKTYCPNARMTAPLPCPCGYYCNSSNTVTPTRCPVGSWCPAFSKSPIRCSRKYYCNHTGLCLPSYSLSWTWSGSKESTKSLSKSRSEETTKTRTVTVTSSLTNTTSGEGTATATLRPTSTRTNTTSPDSTSSLTLRLSNTPTNSSSPLASQSMSSSNSLQLSATRSVDNTLTAPPTVTFIVSKTLLINLSDSLLLTHSSTATKLFSRSMTLSESTTGSVSNTRTSLNSSTQTIVPSRGSWPTSSTLSETTSVGTMSSGPSSTAQLPLSATVPSSRSASFTRTMKQPVPEPPLSSITLAAMSMGSAAAGASVLAATDPSSANLLVLVASINCEGNAENQLRASVEAMTWFKSSGAVMSSALSLALMGGVLLLHFAIAAVVAKVRRGANPSDAAFWAEGCEVVRFPNLSMQLAMVLLPSTLLGALAGIALDGANVGGAVVIVICAAVCGALEAVLRVHVLPRVMVEAFSEDAVRLFVDERALCGGRELQLLPAVYWEPQFMSTCFGVLFRRMKHIQHVRVGGIADHWLTMLTVVLRVLSLGGHVACLACCGVMAVLYAAAALIVAVHCPLKSPVASCLSIFQFSTLSLIIIAELVSAPIGFTSTFQLLMSCTVVAGIPVSLFLMRREGLLRKMHRTLKQQRQCVPVPLISAIDTAAATVEWIELVDRRSLPDEDCASEEGTVSERSTSTILDSNEADQLLFEELFGALLERSEALNTADVESATDDELVTSLRHPHQRL